MPASTEFERGRIVSHFEILELLGRGGMGLVYRALDRALQRDVVLKVLLPEVQDDGSAAQRLRREARAASALSHPNVVTIYEVGQFDGVDFIAMEYVEGQTLADLLRSRALAIGEVLDFGRQLAEGLSAAHARGIVHRDLKPGNVLVTGDARLKILDFGLAKRFSAPTNASTEPAPEPGLDENLTAPGIVVGTARYMSPEQVMGAEVDARSDLFALGCILHEMLCGAAPFRGASTTQIATSILRDRPPSIEAMRPETPKGLVALVDRLLAKSPAERPQGTEVVLAELRRLAATSDTPQRAGDASPETLAFPTARTRGSSRLRSIALASTLLVGAGVIASTYLGVHTGTPKSGDPRLLSTFPGRYARPDYSPDGSLMTFVGAQSTETPQVWLMRLDDLSPRKLTQGESPALNAVFTADGRAIVFERADAGIWRIAVDGIGGETRIVARGRNPSTSALGDLAWEDDGAIWLADGNGRQQRRLEGPLPARYADRMAPAFSPDGKLICWFQSERDTPIGRLMVAEVDGATPPRVLTKAPFRGGWPEWTPDGRFILYSSSLGGATTLWSVPSGGGQSTPVTIGSGDDDHPAIRADGREIAYTNQRREFALLRRDAESGEVRALIRQQREFVLPSVSPDGNRIAYFSPVIGGKAQIFTIGTDGSNPVQLTRDNSFNMAPSWSADSTSILYYRKEPEPALVAMPANGGASVDLAQGWTYGIQTQAQRSPNGLSVAYTLVAQGASQATRIRLLDPGTERPLARVINSPAWWPDGRSIVGTTEDQRILRCPEDGSECAEVTTGSRPIPGPDGALYFLRVEQPALHAVWRRSPDGEERRLAVLEGSAWGGFGYGVLPDGDIVWSASLPGTQEIWVTELH